MLRAARATEAPTTATPMLTWGEGRRQWAVREGNYWLLMVVNWLVIASVHSACGGSQWRWWFEMVVGVFGNMRVAVGVVMVVVVVDNVGGCDG